MPTSPDHAASERWARHLADPSGFSVAALSEGATVPSRWASRWAAAPGAPALAFADGESSRWTTAGELDERTRRAAAALGSAGLGAGDRMVWSAPASLDAVVALVAALRLGAVVVPANPAYTERELAHVAADVRPTVAVVERAEQAGWVTAAAQGAVALATDLSVLAGRPRGAAHPGSAPGEGVLDAATGDDPALIVFTSGTTGAPKGAVLSHANLLAGLGALELAWRWSAEDRLVLALPLFHVHGLCAGLMGALSAGASAAVLGRFTPEGVADVARSERATVFFGVPTMYHRLVSSGLTGALGRLRLCVSGSAALPAPLWHQVRRAAGVAVLERYGMTETLLTLSNPYDGERRPGTVGFELPGVEVRIEDPDGPADIGAGAQGQLFVRGPSVFSGYWERPAANQAAFTSGWFATGDVVSADGDGYLAIRGRRSDLVVSGGFNVYPAEVEDVLLGHPSVAEVAVSGEPSEEWGETVVAWVVPASRPLPVDSLEQLAAQRLAPYKRPRRYRVVDALPRNAMGKLQRDRLRE